MLIFVCRNVCSFVRVSAVHWKAVYILIGFAVGKGSGGNGHFFFKSRLDAEGGFINILEQEVLLAT